MLIACAVAGVGTATNALSAHVCLRAAPIGCQPQFQFDMGAKVMPKALPKRERVPVRLGINGGITQGPPLALREAVLDLDEDVAVDVRGLPVCSGGRRELRRSLRQVENTCETAIVGRGMARFRISFPEQQPIPTSSRVAVFNGGVQRGAVMLFAVAELRVPVPALMVTTITLRRRTPSSWTAVARLPVIAGGSGAVTRFSLNVGRNFIRRGKRRSLLSARCPDGKFELSVPKLLFRNEANLPGPALQTVLKGNLIAPCKPKG